MAVRNSKIAVGLFTEPIRLYVRANGCRRCRRLYRTGYSASAKSASVVAVISPSLCPPGKCEASLTCGDAAGLASHSIAAEAQPKRLARADQMGRHGAILKNMRTLMLSRSSVWRPRASMHRASPSSTSRNCSPPTRHHRRHQKRVGLRRKPHSGATKPRAPVRCSCVSSAANIRALTEGWNEWVENGNPTEKLDSGFVGELRASWWIRVMGEVVQ